MTQQPDILLFLSDDHGQWACSPYGNSELRTPVLQWLADTGARMDNAFTPSPVCSPARASFWTGKIPSAHGVHDYLKENPNNLEGERHPGIEEQVNLAQLLQARGYRTGQFGKWHAGGGGHPVPGFDRWFSSLWGTGAGFREQCFSADGEEVRWFGHQAPEVTRRAIDFFRECKQENPEQPVFLVVGYTDTHTPHAGQSPWRLGPHAESAFPDIPRETFAGCHGDPFFPYDADTAKAQAENRDYYAAVEWIDAQAGEVLEAVRAEGALDEALVLYLSDHGHMNGHHGLHTKGNATRPQNFLEESIRIPWLMRWPGRIAEGQSREESVDLCDAFATVLEAAGGDPADAARADGVERPGRSVLPLFGEDASDWRDVQICEYGNARMIRTKRHKLIRRGPAVNYAVEDEFYDLAEDPRERSNRIADADPSLLAELDGRLEAYFRDHAVTTADGFDARRYAGDFNLTEPWEKS